MKPHTRVQEGGLAGCKERLGINPRLSDFRWLIGEVERLRKSEKEYESEALERVAAFCHSQWSGWMKYLFSKSSFPQGGGCLIPEWATERWLRQMKTDYMDLSDQEKESDRKEARGFLAALDQKAGEPGECQAKYHMDQDHEHCQRPPSGKSGPEEG